jgi:surfactin synthase thioesterase subunit
VTPSTITASDAWIRRWAPASSQPDVRLLCFPFAGGSASLFRDWRLPEHLAAEVWAVQLPGRENRIDEEPFHRMEPLVEALAANLAGRLDRPYAFFGHSMGAIVAFELTRTLRRQGSPLPAHLFLSAHRAPHLPPRHPPISGLPEDEFLARLPAATGGSAAWTAEPELVALLAPMMRADIELCDRYEYREEAPLDVPITCFAAEDDDVMSVPSVAEWAGHTSAPFRLSLHDGDHMFVRDRGVELLEQVASDLAVTTAAP